MALAEQHDEWIEGRRYLGLDVLNRSRLTLLDSDTDASPSTRAKEVSANLNALTT